MIPHIGFTTVILDQIAAVTDKLKKIDFDVRITMSTSALSSIAD